MVSDVNSLYILQIKKYEFNSNSKPSEDTTEKRKSVRRWIVIIHFGILFSWNVRSNSNRFHFTRTPQTQKIWGYVIEIILKKETIA